MPFNVSMDVQQRNESVFFSVVGMNECDTKATKWLAENILFHLARHQTIIRMSRRKVTHQFSTGRSIQSFLFLKCFLSFIAMPSNVHCLVKDAQNTWTDVTVVNESKKNVQPKIEWFESTRSKWHFATFTWPNEE